MKESAQRRLRGHLALVLCSLVLLASAERRIAYLDFNSVADSLRIENNEKVDADEIIHRLVFVDDATEPRAPEADARVTTLALSWAGPRAVNSYIHWRTVC